MNKKDIKLLVVSNNCFSKKNSNGRTIMNLLNMLDKNSIAQFYLSGNPDNDFCSNYFNVSDHDALDAFLHKSNKKSSNLKTKETNKEQISIPKKSLLNYILRDIVWTSMFWWKADFNVFLDDFCPNIVLLQAGDSPFMYRIAYKISKKYNAKLVMFNTESYVLKKKIYDGNFSKYNLFNLILMHRLKRAYKLFMKYSDYCIYNIKELENAYQAVYPHLNKSCSIYTGSNMNLLEDTSSTKKFTLLYCGNIGVGRYKCLDEIARVLYTVDKNAKIDIYGQFENKEQEDFVTKNPNVNYYGFVDYSKIPSLMSNASMLIHCENSEKIINLKYAFSTKIADSLASGRPFLVYASINFPFVQYLVNNNCAHVASNEEELKLILEKCIKDVNFRNKYSKNARKVAIENHNFTNNGKKVFAILNDLLKK